MNKSTKRAPVLLALMMALSVMAAWLWLPKKLDEPSPPALADMVPAEFGGWKEITVSAAPVAPYVSAENPRDSNNPYTDILARTYTNSRGEIVQLMLAYANRVSQEVKVHRPELCYYAQGYTVQFLAGQTLPLSDAVHVDVLTMLTTIGERLEPVTYWIRIGDEIPMGAWRTRWVIFREGIHGRVSDGMLVRVSSFAKSEGEVSFAPKLQHQFLQDLYRALAARARQFLVKA